jgi:MSHA biogenesis protein MshQ
LTAVVWEAADDIDNDGVPDNQGALAANAATPNFGRETTPATATLSHALAEPVGGAPGTLSGTTTFSGFSTGASTQSVAFSEVGIIDLLAQTTNYLGSGQNITAGASGLTGVGRFIPHHFDVTKIHGCTGGATFTYSGQPFATLTATARNLAGVTTSNYRDFGGGVVFSKDTTVSNAGATANFTNNVIAASSFANGIGNQNNVTYTFPTPPGKDTVPLTLTLRAVDNDSVSSAGFTEETAEIRSGRLRIINAYGSELVPMPVPMRVEYYSTDGWVTNAADTCTSVLAASLSLSNTSAPTPVSPPTQKKMNDTSATTTGASVANSPFLNGDAGLSFSAPGAGGDGYVDVTPDLSAKTWLRYDWDDNGSLDDPSGRATFGLYRGSPRHIYQRERY